MYLLGMRVDAGSSGTDIPVCLFSEDDAEGKKKRQARMPVPPYLEAIERLVWHAERGHLIVIVSGTLEPLAERAVRALEAKLGQRGFATKILVRATRLEEKHARWTGRVLGEVMFGEAKARAVRRIAVKENLDLRRCFAYGDSASDRGCLRWSESQRR
jgi:HAD superfamily phosphoserine phosphatase-like hydrolase